MIPSGSLPGFVTQTLWEGFLQAKWAREILTKDNEQRSHALWFRLRDFA